MGGKQIIKYENIARNVRMDILRMTLGTGILGAHLGGSLSMVEMLTALYAGNLRYDATNPLWEERDRVILSKGHAAMALYAVLAETGIIEKNMLKDFKKNGSLIGGHPSLNGLSGIEFASGSLGQGLSLGVGVSIALRKKNIQDARVFVFLGDGECNEGSIWEAAASAAQFNCNNLIAVVDRNHIQYDGLTKTVLNMAPMENKWKDFGWDAEIVDGHDMNALLDAYQKKNEKPLVILADTVKGKGISFMENNPKYHNAALSKETFEKAMAELSEDI